MKFKAIIDNIKKQQKHLTINFIRNFYGKISSHVRSQGNLDSIVILAREGFGDIIVLSPLIKILKRVNPEMEITIVCVNRLAYYLKYDKNIKLVINGKYPTRAVKKYIFEQEFDLLFNPKDHPSVTFLYLSARIRAKHRVGIYHPLHEGFFHHMIRFDDPVLMIKKSCMLLDYLGISYTEKDLLPYIPDGPVSPEVIQFAKNIKGKDVMAINLSASNNTKEWHFDKWIEFLKNVKQAMIIIAMPKHYKQKQIIENSFRNVIKSPPTKSIFDVSYVIQHLKLLISPDTSLIHIASCFNVPVLAFYRIENDLIEFAPLSDKQYTIVAPDGEIDKIHIDTVTEIFNTFVRTL